MHHVANFEKYLGIVLDEAGVGRVRGHVDVAAFHTQPYGIVHGGVYCAIVETLGSVGAAIWAREQGMEGAVGIHNATDFIRSTRGGTIEGVATPIHRGRSQQLWTVDLTRASDGRLLARGQLRMQNLSDPDVVGGMTHREPPSV